MEGGDSKREREASTRHHRLCKLSSKMQHLTAALGKGEKLDQPGNRRKGWNADRPLEQTPEEEKRFSVQDSRSLCNISFTKLLVSGNQNLHHQAPPTPTPGLKSPACYCSFGKKREKKNHMGFPPANSSLQVVFLVSLNGANYSHIC